jgi:hypothetical protein
MRFVRVDKNRTAEVPTSWPEAEKMLAHALGAYYDARGRNLAKLSIAARAMHGMFGKELMSPDPTTTLLFLLQRITLRRGAGLDKPLPARRGVSKELTHG